MTFSSFFRSNLPACSLPSDPITCSIIKGVLIFVALSGTSAYYSMRLAEFCSTMPQIELKTKATNTNLTTFIHPNATDTLGDIDKMKNFINWFNHLQPYDICFYGAFGTTSCLALIFSIATINLFMLSHMELKKKPSERSDECLFGCLSRESNLGSEEHYSRLISSTEENQSLDAYSMS